MTPNLRLKMIDKLPPEILNRIIDEISWTLPSEVEEDLVH